MKRALTSLVAISLLLLSNPAQSAAPSAKVGAACSKVGATAKAGSVSLTCVKSGKKLLWTKVSVQPPKPNTTPSSAPTQPAPAPSPTSNPLPTTVYYTAKDQSTVVLLNSVESCSNPKNASFEIQALVGSDWLPVKLIDSGWNVSTQYCSNPDLGARTSLSWAKVYIDEGTKYRWIYSGEINMQFRDAQGRGTSQTYTVPRQPKPFKAKIPIILPAAQNGTITFANILDHISEIQQVAFSKTEEVISKSSITTPVSNVIHVGPNTQFDITGGLTKIQEVLLRSQKLWGGFTQVSKFNVLMYNAQDEPWAEQDFRKTAELERYFSTDIEAEIRRIAGNCQETVSPGVFKGTPSNCRGADSAALTSSDDAILTIGQGSPDAANDPFAKSGAVFGHEYAHSVQAAQWIGKWSSYCTPETQNEKCFRSWNSNWGFSPCWLFEGLPNSAGVMGIYSSFEDYKSYRNVLPYSRGVTTVTDYTQPSLLNYLVNQSHSSCYNDGSLYTLGYSVGAIAVEALISIAGPQSVMALYALGAEGQEFEDAFKNVYGISWSEGSVILSKVLAAEYATYGPPPK